MTDSSIGICWLSLGPSSIQRSQSQYTIVTLKTSKYTGIGIAVNVGNDGYYTLDVWKSHIPIISYS
jgi:hypothetical protein